MDLYLKISDNFSKSKKLYQKKLIASTKIYLTSSTASPYSNLNWSLVPKELQIQLSLDKAKKSIFYDDSLTEPLFKIRKNRFYSTIKNNSEEEKDLINDLDMNQPIYEESSGEEISSKEGEDSQIYLDYGERKFSKVRLIKELVNEGVVKRISFKEEEWLKDDIEQRISDEEKIEKELRNNGNKEIILMKNNIISIRRKKSSLKKDGYKEKEGMSHIKRIAMEQLERLEVMERNLCRLEFFL